MIIMCLCPTNNTCTDWFDTLCLAGQPNSINQPKPIIIVISTYSQTTATTRSFKDNNIDKRNVYAQDSEIVTEKEKLYTVLFCLLLYNC